MDYRLGELMHLILVCQAIKKKSFDGIRMFSIKKLGEIGSLYSSYCERVVKHDSDQTHFSSNQWCNFQKPQGAKALSRDGRFQWRAKQCCLRTTFSTNTLEIVNKTWSSKVRGNNRWYQIFVSQGNHQVLVVTFKM